MKRPPTLESALRRIEDAGHRHGWPSEMVDVVEKIRAEARAAKRKDRLRQLHAQRGNVHVPDRVRKG